VLRKYPSVQDICLHAVYHHPIAQSRGLQIAARGPNPAREAILSGLQTRFVSNKEIIFQ